MNFNSKHAYTFQVACEEGSIRAASERLELEPSSISRQISALEKSFSIDLIERSRSGIIPTEAGIILLDYLSHQQSELEAVRAEFDALLGMHKGEIVTALGDGFIGDFVGHALHQFQRNYPGFTHKLQSGSTEQVIHSVKTNQAHFGMVFNARAEKNIRVISHQQQPLYLLVSPHSPWSKLKEPVSLDTLKTIPLALLAPGFGVGAMIKGVENKYSVRLNSLVHANSLTTLKSFVVEEIGATILPEFVVTREIKESNIVVKSLDVPELALGEVSIIVRQGRRLPRGAIALMNAASNYMVAFN